MPRDDYEAISKIIEEVVGKDTITAVTLLQGIKYYFDNKEEQLEIIREEKLASFKSSGISKFKDEADNAMKRYTAQLNIENAKYKKKASEVS